MESTSCPPASYLAWNPLMASGAPSGFLVKRRESCLNQGDKTTARGFEPLRAEPNGFRVHLLSRSDTLSCGSAKLGPAKEPRPSMAQADGAGGGQARYKPEWAGRRGGGKARKCCSSERVETLFGSQQRGAGAKLAEVLEMGLEPTISSLGGRRLIH